MSCTTLEITCSCTDQNFIFTNNSLTASPADTAVRIHYNCTCLHENIKKSFLKSLTVNCLTCRNNKETDLICNFLSFDNFCSDTKIFNTSIITGTQKCFINLNSTHFLCRT